jgi:hypothetical protein
MTDVFLKEFTFGEIAAGEQMPLEINGKLFSESVYKKFVPALAVTATNNSGNDIKVFVNQTNDNAFRLPPNSSRSLTSYPIWDITVQNLGETEIAANTVILTLVNDIEQVGRYKAYAKKGGIF